MKGAIVLPGNAAHVIGIERHRFTFEMIEFDVRSVSDSTIRHGNFEAEIAVFVITDDIIFGEASDGLENGFCGYKAGTCDRWDKALLARGRIVPRHALMKMLIEPAPAM